MHAVLKSRWHLETHISCLCPEWRRSIEILLYNIRYRCSAIYYFDFRLSKISVKLFHQPSEKLLDALGFLKIFSYSPRRFKAQA